MLISSILNDSFGLLSKQLRFYCWHFRRNLDQRQRQELIELLQEQHFERLANKIKSLNHSSIADCKQQVGKLLFEQCLTRNRRHQLVQIIESKLVDINVRLDNYGRTLLHRSAYNLDVELVKILIEQGVNIRLRDYAGNTALHIAIQSYRNGAVIFGNGRDVVQNLTSIMRLLLEADKSLQSERYKRKRVKLLTREDDVSNISKCKQNDRHQQYNLGADNQASTLEEVDINQQLMTSQQTSIVKSSSSPISDDNSNVTEPTRKSIDPNNNLHSGRSLNISNSNIEYTRIDRIGAKYLTIEGTKQPDDTIENINPILLEDVSSSLIDTKNAFGRTALHYCVLVVGEQHLAHFVKLLISYGADTDAIDTRMRTPLYCLVKRPGISAIRQKCLAITQLLESGCDDLGLAIPEPRVYFSGSFIENLEQNISTILQSKTESPSVEPIFNSTGFARVSSLKHLARLRLIKLQSDKDGLKRQKRLSLPGSSPTSLNLYMNKKILDQSELF